MSEEWGPWIEHDGKGCPCVGEFVEAVNQLRGRWRGVAGSQGGYSWDWGNYPAYTMFLRYRIRKPKGLTILERIASQPQERVEA